MALATPEGEGALGLIRMSGLEAITIAGKVFCACPSVDLTAVPSHTIHYGYVVDGEKDKITDEVLLFLLRSPRTYTGEDTIEISGHGNPFVLQKIIAELLHKGARLAEPGEFTKRAFLNGRIDLSQAEAVADLIQARSEQSSEFAIRQIKGSVSEEIKQIQSSLKEELVAIEAEIDFSDDVGSGNNREHLEEKLTDIFAKMQRLILGYNDNVLINKGIKLALIGKANVGKSSLFNLLVNDSQRALVTPIPGTTRDILAEEIYIQGRMFRLLDTAGIKRPRGRLEAQSVALTKSTVQSADSFLLVLDNSKYFGKNDLNQFKQSIPIPLKQSRKAGQFLIKPTLVVINKIDLPGRLSEAKIGQILPDSVIIKISCKTGAGLEELKQAIAKLILPNSTLNKGKEAIVTNLRHKENLEKSSILINHAISALQDNLSQEFIAADIRHTLETLQQITGETVTDDLLDEIFAKFCIGK